MDREFRRRAGWLIASVMIIAIAGFHLYRSGPEAGSWLPHCTFHRLTGLHCPGCGMTRATHATLHGEIGNAFRLNPVGMILVPLGLAGIALHVLSWVSGKSIPSRLQLGPRGLWALTGIVIVFGILRNLPLWPFTFLAPP